MTEIQKTGTGNRTGNQRTGTRKRTGNTEVHLEPYKASKMIFFRKIVNGWKPLTIFVKYFILGVWQGSENASETILQTFTGNMKFTHRKYEVSTDEQNQTKIGQNHFPENKNSLLLRTIRRYLKEFFYSQIIYHDSLNWILPINRKISKCCKMLTSGCW